MRQEPLRSTINEFLNNALDGIEVSGQRSSIGSKAIGFLYVMLNEIELSGRQPQRPQTHDFLKRILNGIKPWEPMRSNGPNSLVFLIKPYISVGKVCLRVRSTHKHTLPIDSRELLFLTSGIV